MSVLNMLCEVITDTFMKVCGKHQVNKEPSERKAFRVCFSLRLDYEKEEGYRYLEMVLWGPMNYVQVWVRESWDVIPIEDLEDEDDGGPKPGKSYTKGAGPWELVGDHDSCWPDGIKRTVAKNKERINGFSGGGDWYKVISSGACSLMPAIIEMPPTAVS